MSNQHAIFVWNVTRYGADKSMIDFNVRNNGKEFTSVMGCNIQDMEKGEQHGVEFAGDAYIEGLNGLWKDRHNPIEAFVKIYRTRKRGDYRVNIHVTGISFRSYAMNRSSTLFELYVPIMDDGVLDVVQ
jgi:hypothetical protein